MSDYTRTYSTFLHGLLANRTIYGRVLLVSGRTYTGSFHSRAPDHIRTRSTDTFCFSSLSPSGNLLPIKDIHISIQSQNLFIPSTQQRNRQRDFDQTNLCYYFISSELYPILIHFSILFHFRPLLSVVNCLRLNDADR